MQLNSLSPSSGSKKNKTRVGRGIGSGFGKTAGRGHKGQKSRSGGGVRPGFEGGQQPLQRRLPKYGFSSRKSNFSTEIRLEDLQKIDPELETIDLQVLQKHGLVSHRVKKVKVILSRDFISGKVKQIISASLKGINASKEARKVIENAGGKFLEG